jgi:SAM-dependent methyltransferase
MHKEEWLPVWEAKRVAEEIAEGAIFQNLCEAARKELAEIPDLKEKVVGALENPKPLDISRPVFNAVLAAQYYEVFEALAPPRNLALYEPCVGGSNPVIVATEAYSRGKAKYLTINLNRKLREELRSTIAHLRMEIRIIEDNAQRALAHLQPDTFDVACFHHAVNDILQTAVSEPRGMDTTAVDWFPSERQMIEWLAEDVKAGRVEQRGKPELMQIVGDACRLVRPGGYLVFDHFNWCKFIGVDWFPWDLFYNLIPMTRRWVAESGLPVQEVKLDGADPQWWMFLQVRK